MMNEVQKFILFSHKLYKEMGKYVAVEQLDVYAPSVINYTILYLVTDYKDNLINEFELQKYIDIIYGYDFAYNDGLIDLDSLYRHLMETVEIDVLKVHRDDCNKFGLNIKEPD